MYWIGTNAMPYYIIMLSSFDLAITKSSVVVLLLKFVKGITLHNDKHNIMLFNHRYHKRKLQKTKQI